MNKHLSKVILYCSYVWLLMVLMVGCSSLANTIRVRCPPVAPVAPELVYETTELPQTELELEKEYLKLRAAYDETAEAERVWRELYDKCD